MASRARRRGARRSRARRRFAWLEVTITPAPRRRDAALLCRRHPEQRAEALRSLQGAPPLPLALRTLRRHRHCHHRCRRRADLPPHAAHPLVPPTRPTKANDVRKAAQLLALKADPNGHRDHGSTCLHVACQHKLSSKEIVALLLKAGADPVAEDADGWQALHCAVLRLGLGLG